MKARATAATKQHHWEVDRYGYGYPKCFIPKLVFILFISSAAFFFITSLGVFSKDGGGERWKELPRNNDLDSSDVFSGEWIYDNSSAYPLYTEKGCSFMSDIVACEKFGRRDLEYQKWRWKPHGHGYHLPRFDAQRFLEKMRGKRLVFVGDSLVWNQWISLLCLLQSSIPNLQNTMQPHGSLKVFRATKYNATIECYWAPLLVESNSDDPLKNQFPDRIIRAESIKKHAVQWTDAHFLVFNSYLWWRRPEIKVLWGSFDDDEDDRVYKDVDALRSFQLMLSTWANWLEFHIDRSKTQIFFMSLSPTHFWADEWGGSDRGNCYNESEPIRKHGQWGRGSDVRMMKAVEEAIKLLSEKGVDVRILNITQLSEYRKDGHPSIYRQRWDPLTEEQKNNPSSYSDCLHWCLPGVPDVWNQILTSYIN